jgi:Transmembrane secretion effector
MNATMVVVANAATALGGVLWGLAAHNAGVVPTFLGAAVLALVMMIIVRLVPALRISIDFTKSLSFESAPGTIFSKNLDPSRLPAPKDGPVSITAEFNVDPTRRNECVELMRDARMIFLRNGAYRWHLYEDLKQPNKFRMEVVVPSWKEHLLQRERMTKNEKDILLKLRNLRIDPNLPEEWIYLSVEKEVLNRRVRATGLPPDYIDQ